MVVDEHDAGQRAHGSITSSTSVPAPGRVWISARPPWRSIRPEHRLAQPAPVGRHGGEVEARPAVAHEHLDAVALHLGVDADRGVGRELDGVEHRLARGGDQRARALVERAVADRHDLDRDAVRVLDLGDRRLERGGERVVAGRSAREPAFSHARSSRSWRRASAATSRGSPARFCISASVCSTESCRCAASSARSCVRIRSARSSVSPRPSRSHHGARITVIADDHDEHGERDVAVGHERAVEPEEDERGADHQRGAERDEARSRGG